MKRFNADVCSLNHPFQECPKVFDAVCVNRTVNVVFGVFHESMGESFGAECVISTVFIGINVRSFFHAAFDDLVNRFHPLLRNNMSADFAFLSVLGMSFKQSKHSLFTSATRSSLNRLASAICVHVAGKTANIGFIDFNCLAVAAHLFKTALLYSKPETVSHEPSGFLSNAKSAGNLTRTDPVLSASYHPHSSEPLIQWNRRILKDRADLHRKLFLTFTAAPHTAIRHVDRLFGSAARAWRFTIRPTKRCHELNTNLFVGEILYALL